MKENFASILNISLYYYKRFSGKRLSFVQKIDPDIFIVYR